MEVSCDSCCCNDPVMKQSARWPELGARGTSSKQQVTGNWAVFGTVNTLWVAVPFFKGKKRPKPSSLQFPFPVPRHPFLTIRLASTAVKSNTRCD